MFNSEKKKSISLKILKYIFLLSVWKHFL